MFVLQVHICTTRACLYYTCMFVLQEGERWYVTQTQQDTAETGQQHSLPIIQMYNRKHEGYWGTPTNLENTVRAGQEKTSKQEVGRRMESGGEWTRLPRKKTLGPQGSIGRVQTKQRVSGNQTGKTPQGSTLNRDEGTWRARERVRYINSANHCPDRWGVRTACVPSNFITGTKQDREGSLHKPSKSLPR